MANGLEGAEGMAADVGGGCAPPRFLLRQLERETPAARRQPMQKAGWRTGQRLPPGCAATAAPPAPVAGRAPRVWPTRWRAPAGSRRQTGSGPASAPRRCTRRRRATGPCRAIGSGYRAGAGWWRFPCSMYSGWPSSTTSTARWAGAEGRDLVGHQRAGDVEHQQRDVAGAERVASSSCCRLRTERVGTRPPWTTMPRSACLPVINSLRPLSTM